MENIVTNEMIISLIGLIAFFAAIMKWRDKRKEKEEEYLSNKEKRPSKKNSMKENKKHPYKKRSVKELFERIIFLYHNSHPYL